MKIYYEVRKDVDGYEVQKRDPGMKTLAIMDFTNSSITDKEDFDPLQQGLATLMIHNLNGATDLKVVERERIQWLLEEQALQRDTDVVDQQTAVRAGKLLGAHAVLFGGFIVNNRRMWVNARLVDVETGEILLTEQVNTRPDDFFEADLWPVVADPPPGWEIHFVKAEDSAVLPGEACDRIRQAGRRNGRGGDRRGFAALDGRAAATARLRFHRADSGAQAGVLRVPGADRAQ